MATTRPSPDFEINGDPGPAVQLAANTIYSASLISTDGVSQTAWTVSRWDDSTDPSLITGDGSWVQSGSVGQTIQFQTLGEGTAGTLRPTIEAGEDPVTGASNSPLMSTEVKWYVPTGTGLEVTVNGEQVDGDNVSNAVHGITAPLNAAIRGEVPADTFGPGVTPARVADVVVTGGGGATTVYTFTPPNDGEFFVTAICRAKQGADRNIYAVVGSYKVTSAVVTAIAASEITIQHEDDATWDVAWSTDATDILLKLTPDASDTTFGAIISIVEWI